MKSLYKGVYSRTNSKRFKAILCLNYKQMYLGDFDTEEEAAHAWDLKVIELNLLDKRKLNFPIE